MIFLHATKFQEYNKIFNDLKRLINILYSQLHKFKQVTIGENVTKSSSCVPLRMHRCLAFQLLNIIVLNLLVT